MTTSKRPPTRRRQRIPLWGLLLAALASIALLAAAVIGAGEQATLRPMAASESMTDEQALAVAANTARVWLREQEAGHVANFQALTCKGQLLGDVEHAKHHDATPTAVTAIGRLVREGPLWKLDTRFTDRNELTWQFQIVDGGLLVCGFETPTGLF